MLVYEKNNKLNINFDNEISENPDLQISKEDGKTEIVVDGQKNSSIPVPVLPDDVGKAIIVSEDGSYELAEVGGNGPLVLKFATVFPSYTVATPLSEIKAAIDAGRQVWFDNSSVYVPLTSYSVSEDNILEELLFNVVEYDQGSIVSYRQIKYINSAWSYLQFNI